MRKKSFLKLIVFTLFFGFFVCACTQTVPEVRSGSCSLILEYNSLDSLPDVKLSVFFQSESEVRRYESFTVKALSSDYSWNVTDIIKLNENKKNFIGYNNLVMPQDTKFPTGSYNVVFKNLDEEETEINISLNYNSEIYSLKGKQVNNYIKNKNYRKKYAVYSEDGYLLFYGQLYGENSSLEKILYNYSEAVYYNEVLISSSGNITFIMPKQYFEEKDKE